MLKIRAGQWSITANLWPLTTHIYHEMFIVTIGISKKSFLLLQLFPRNSLVKDLELVSLEFKHFYKTQRKIKHRIFLSVHFLLVVL